MNQTDIYNVPVKTMTEEGTIQSFDHLYCTYDELSNCFVECITNTSIPKIHTKDAKDLDLPLFALEEDKFVKVPLKDYQNYLKKMRNPRVRQDLENRIHNILLASETQKEKRITL